MAKAIKLSDDLWQLLDRLNGCERIIWDIQLLDSNYNINNKLDIDVLDMSDKSSYFDVVVNKKTHRIKIVNFLETYYGKKYSAFEIEEFISEYNKIIGGVQPKNTTPIKPRPFKYEPLNIRDTFISLVTETYPMGYEDEVVPLLKKGLKKDKFGNYYYIIGNSTTAFTSHLDTVSRKKENINLQSYTKDGQEFIVSDETTILGADDKAGVCILLYMIEHNIPGVYWFFYGEERGGQGSARVADNLNKYPFMKNVNKIISFDRRNYFSVITSQMGTECCSKEFAVSLCSELNNNGLNMSLDPTGVFTDSANFIELIPECTNVSVGYFNEHTHNEIQNITFLEKLAKSCVKVNWEKLVVKRRVGFSNNILLKYDPLIKGMKKLVFNNTEKIMEEKGKLVIILGIDNPDPNNLYDDLVSLRSLFVLHKLDPDITFDNYIIKIELN
mgnify:CR=1 FL=1|jgi:hypothetical protein